MQNVYMTNIYCCIIVKCIYILLYNLHPPPLPHNISSYRNVIFSMTLIVDRYPLVIS